MRVLYAKPLNERLIILLPKKNVILASIFIIFSSASSSSSAIVALFASAGIRPVVNGLKQDTTVYCVTASYFARSLNLIWYNDVMVE